MPIDVMPEPSPQQQSQPPSQPQPPAPRPQQAPVAVAAVPIAIASPMCEDAFMPVVDPSRIQTSPTTSSPSSRPFTAAPLPQQQQRQPSPSRSWDAPESEPLDLGEGAADPTLSPMRTPQPQQQHQPSAVTPQTPQPQPQSQPQPEGKGAGIPNEVQHRAWLLEELRNLSAMGVTIPIEVTWDTPMAELERLYEYAEDALNDKMGTDLMFFGYVRLIKAVEVANAKLDPVGRITGNKTCLDGAADRIMQDARLRDSLRTPLKMIYRKHFKTSVVTEASPFMQLGLVTWDLLQQVNAENTRKERNRRKRQQQRQRQQQKGSLNDEDVEDEEEDDCESDRSDAACDEFMPGDDDFDPTNAPDSAAATPRSASKKAPPPPQAAVAAKRAPPPPTTPKPRAATFVPKTKPSSTSPVSAKPPTCDTGEDGSCPIVPMTVIGSGGGSDDKEDEFDITIPMSPAFMGSPAKRASK